VSEIMIIELGEETFDNLI